jgi:hypothetical protein
MDAKIKKQERISTSPSTTNPQINNVPTSPAVPLPVGPTGQLLLHRRARTLPFRSCASTGGHAIPAPPSPLHAST